MINIVICDDNETIVKELEQMVDRCTDIPVCVSSCSDLNELQGFINKTAKIDILLLDIILKDEDGIQFAKELLEKRPDIKIIFITGYLNQTRRLFTVGAVRFLVKPIKDEELKIVLEDVISQLESEKKTFITLKVHKKIIKLKAQDIYYIESRTRVVNIYGKDSEQSVHIKLDEFMKQMPDMFLRVHKSYAVNMDKIQYFSAEGVILQNGQKVSISRSKYKEAKERFLSYCGNQLM